MSETETILWRWKPPLGALSRTTFCPKLKRCSTCCNSAFGVWSQGHVAPALTAGIMNNYPSRMRDAMTDES